MSKRRRKTRRGGLAMLNASAAPGSAPGGAAGTLSAQTVALAQPMALAAAGVTVDAATGVIAGAAVMAIGPAMGHGFEIDATTLDQLVELGQAAGSTGIKMRLSHPELDIFGTRDGAELLTGRARNFRRDGDRVRADLHVARFAEHAPGGNRRAYLLAIADEDPGLLGLSVVAHFDFEDELDDRGEVTRTLARMRFLKAVDFVDDPAANRNGLLSTNPQQPTEGRTMNRLRKYLLSIGKIQQNATDQQVLAALSTLDAKPKRIATVLRQLDEAASDDAKPTRDQVAELQSAGADLTALGIEAPAPAAGGSGGGSGGGNAPANDPTPSGGAGDNGGSGAGPSTNLSTGSQPQPANTPAPAGGGDVTGQVQAALAAERERVNGLRQLATQLGLGRDWADRHEQNGTTLAAAQPTAIDDFSQSNQGVRGLGGRVTGGEDGRVSLMQGIEDAMTLRCGGTFYEEAGPARTDPTQPLRLRRGDDGRPALRQPHERMYEFEHLSAVEIGRIWLSQLGVPSANSIDPWQVARYCTDRYELAGVIGGRALSHGTSDFPAVFANVLNKTLLPAYEEELSTWEAWAIEQEVKDFREARMVSLGRVGRPPRVMEGAEYEYGTLQDKYETLRVFKHGLLLALTWEMFVNDDLSAFIEGAFGFAQTSKALENDLVYEELTGNPTLKEDSKTIFHADHKNLNEGGAAAFNKDTLKEMRKAMALQRGLAPKDGQQGRRLNLRPNTLLVPWELDVAAAQLVASMVDPSKNNNTPNYQFLRTLNIVTESRLDDNSTTAHYLVAAKNRSAPAMKVAKLRGYKTPTIERMSTGSSVDGVTWKLRHVCGAGMGDFRSIQRNDGA